MAAPVFLSNDRNATEVVIDNRATQEVVLVSQRYPNASPVRIVTRVRTGVKEVKIVNVRQLVNGETL